MEEEEFKTKMDELTRVISIFEQVLLKRFADISAQVDMPELRSNGDIALMWGYKNNREKAKRHLFLLGYSMENVRLSHAPALYRVAATSVFIGLLDELEKVKPERLRKIEEGTAATLNAIDRCLERRERGEIQAT